MFVFFYNEKIGDVDMDEVDLAISAGEATHLVREFLSEMSFDVRELELLTKLEPIEKKHWVVISEDHDNGFFSGPSFYVDGMSGEVILLEELTILRLKLEEVKKQQATLHSRHTGNIGG